jgi:hypothetical protein
MALTVLIAMTISCVTWSLWIRRVTWTCRWEVAATLNIALQGAAVLLMSPLASETLGPALHALTGMWNLQAYLGHDCYVVAASAIVYNAVGRLDDDKAVQASFKQYVERPATLCIPLLLATFSIGNGAKIYRPDFFQVPTDFWLSAYWLLLCGTLIYLLGYGSRALLILRKDPRSRRMANVYLTASACGIAACAVRIVTAYVRPIEALERGTLVWIFACACGAGFAIASAHSWRIKSKWFTHASR